MYVLLDFYSVSLPKNPRPYVSMRMNYFSNLTKYLCAQSAHLNYVVLPKINFEKV